MNIVIIPARGGSKGIPGKNIRLLNGKPLIAWSIESALGAKTIDMVTVSTDSDEIASAAERYGAKSVKRPLELAADTAASESALIHCLQQIKTDDLKYIVFMQCTSPLIYPEDIDAAVRLAQDKGFDSVFSAYEEHFTGRWKYKSGRLIPLNYLPDKRPMRQEVPPEIIENGAMYVFTPEVIKNGIRFGTNIGAYLMPKERSFQIDTIEEFRFIEKIMPYYK